MSNQSNQAPAQSGRSRKNRKIAAISAGALVVGLGAAYTLASWNDSEWVWGGADGDPGLGTQTFDVQQNTTLDLAAGGWTDEESNPGGSLQFSTGALQLTPGDTVYAPVSLRTVPNSIAGDIQLQGAVAAAGTPAPQNDADLWNAVRVSVWTNSGAEPAACNASTAGTAGWSQIVNNATLGTAGSAEQAIAATTAGNPGVPQNYCFAITLPENPAGVTDVKSLQGLAISPAWEFQAESN